MRFWLLVGMVLLILAGCNGENEGGASIQQAEKEDKDPNKKVVFVIIDSMMGSLVDNSLEKGTIPALEFLIENGQYYKDLVAPFPSMSVVIESSMVTGEMPNNHKIPGLVWYKDDEQRLVDYGSTIQKAAQLGMKQALFDSLYHLNNTHLNEESTTIFEALQEKGYTTGSVNTLIYRGNTNHDMHLPPVLDNWLGMNGSLQTKGPDLLAFGSVVKPKVVENKNFPDSLFSQFGLNDEYSVEVTKEIIKNGEQPDFLMVFLPDFDKEAHDNSPHYRKGFERAEHLFQDILNAYPSWEQALEENIFIVVGDHGQDKLLDDEVEMAIDLESIYHDYEPARLQDQLTPGEIAFGNNHRMSYVYALENEQLLPRLAETAMVDKRIAHASWLQDGWVHVISPDYDDVVRFRKFGPWADRYDQTWEIEGNEDILTIKKDSNKNELAYVDYPDILNQLYSAHHAHDNNTLILTAKPGHVFKSQGSPLHVGGGEHGGIHKNETLAALVISGTDKEPEYLRMVDLKDYILQLYDDE